VSDSYRRGVLAERRVVLNYQRSGFVVLDRNWRCRAGELALVVAKDSILVIDEVKWRRSAHFGGPAAAVTETKQSRNASSNGDLARRAPRVVST
jgi:putative endonuclease